MREGISVDSDVAIVGGSAAGYLSAALLAEAGQRVAIFERDSRPQAGSRTLIVTSKARRFFGDSVQGAVVNEINRFELFADGQAATIELAEPDLIVERAKVISGLENRAIAAGAISRRGVRFAGLSEGTDGVELNLKTDDLTERMIVPKVVGADGARSKVAQSSGWASQKTVPLVQAIVELPPDVPVDTSRVWFRPVDTPYFYWLVPESPERAALGVIGVEPAATRRILEAFLKEKEFKVHSFQGAMIPAYAGWTSCHRKLGRGDVYLVGDAAGHVKVSTVGGLVTGLWGAVGVTKMILEGNEDSELRRLRRELNLHLLIRKAMHAFTEDDYRDVLRQLSNGARRSLGYNDRDDASRILWSLLRSRPQLLLRGIRSLVASSVTR